MTVEGRRKDDSDYVAVQTSAFTREVEKGTYDEAFEHSDYLKAVFDRAMDDALPSLGAAPLTVLDAGCGTGAWLHHLLKTVMPRHGLAEVRGFGFDLTAAMVEVAARHLKAANLPATVATGSILDPAAYRFADGPAQYDLVFSFDVVQQLPAGAQFDAVRQLVAHTRPGGACIIFDHDRHSPYGYKMAAKKFVSRRLGIALVPRFYCNASYPPLERFRQRIEAEGLGAAHIMVPEDGKKRALVVRPI